MENLVIRLWSILYALTGETYGGFDAVENAYGMPIERISKEQAETQLAEVCYTLQNVRDKLTLLSHDASVYLARNPIDSPLVRLVRHCGTFADSLLEDEWEESIGFHAEHIAEIRFNQGANKSQFRQRRDWGDKIATNGAWQCAAFQPIAWPDFGHSTGHW